MLRVFQNTSNADGFCSYGTPNSSKMHDRCERDRRGFQHPTLFPVLVTGIQLPRVCVA
jgi:hypothetical protein